MLTQVQRGESAPRVTGQYTQGLANKQQNYGSRNQQRQANSMAPQQRYVSLSKTLIFSSHI